MTGKGCHVSEVAGILIHTNGDKSTSSKAVCRHHQDDRPSYKQYVLMKYETSKK
jgi:hypothetical protein